MANLPDTISVSKAAKRHNVTPRTMRAWLAADLGYVFRGRKNRVPVEDVEKVMLRRMGVRKSGGALSLEKEEGKDARQKVVANLGADRRRDEAAHRAFSA